MDKKIVYDADKADRFTGVSSSTVSNTSGAFHPTETPTALNAVKGMFLELGPVVKAVFGEASAVAGVHEAITVIDNVKDNAFKGAQMVLNGDKEFTLEDAATLTASIPYVGDVVNILDKSLKIYDRLKNFTKSNACYRVYWKPQRKRDIPIFKTSHGVTERTLLNGELDKDKEDYGIGESYIELDY